MRVHDLSEAAVALMEQCDLSKLTTEPASEIDSFEFHGCNVGVSAFRGRPPWELHEGGDELLLILAGGSVLTILDGQGGETVQEVSAGQLVIVPQGHWHSNDARDGVTMLWLTPARGNRHSWEAPPT
jgi:mannose-6-phosphate isomerase-like protein (cupin superfamily)